MLVFADSGSGMPEQLRKRAMEPFATGAPGGIGLGLSIVRRIVSAWEAEIQIQSEAGQGTTVRIMFNNARN